MEVLESIKIRVNEAAWENKAKKYKNHFSIVVKFVKFIDYLELFH